MSVVDPYSRLASRPPERKPSRLRRLLAPAVLLVAMWIVYIIESSQGAPFVYRFSLHGANWNSWPAIFTAPFLHLGLAHLLNNSLALVWMGGFTAIEGMSRFLAVTLTSALTSGVIVILLSPPGTLTVGMSGVIFGYFGYLLAAAFVERNLRQKLWRIFSVTFLLFWWGFSMFSGLLPHAAISWQGHLGGAIGGVLVAVIVEKREYQQSLAAPLR